MALPFLQAKKWKKRHAEHFTCHGGAFAETGAMHRVGATPTGNTGNTMNTRRGTWLRENHGLWNFRGTWLAESPIPGPISPIGPISLPASPSFLRNALCIHHVPLFLSKLLSRFFFLRNAKRKSEHKKFWKRMGGAGGKERTFFKRFFLSPARRIAE